MTPQCDRDKSCICARSKPKVPTGSNSNISVWWRPTGKTAIPNSALSPIWDARTSLAPHLESLVALLGGGKKAKAKSLSCDEHIEATVAACWGPMLVARSLWREFGLESILDGLGPKTNSVQKAGRLPLADRVLVLVANRLCRPGSEHALAQWLESDFVCGRDGKRILARWKQQGRVRVDLNGSKNGIARSTSCWRTKSVSKWNSLAGCAICFT